VTIPTNEKSKVIEYEDLVFEIEEVRERRIGKVKIHLKREV
jgi:CBS domain containing-hemolysin-like protein